MSDLRPTTGSDSGLGRLTRSFALLVVVACAVGLSHWGAQARSTGTFPAKTIDLASGRLGGRMVLGRTVAEVTTALGRPAQRSRGSAGYALQYEPVSPRLGSWGVQILFRRVHGVLRAWSIVITDPTFRDSRVGKLLQLTPSALENAVIDKYGDRYVIDHAYHCTPQPRHCRGDLGPTGAGRLHLGVGVLEPTGQPYAVIYS